MDAAAAGSVQLTVRPSATRGTSKNAWLNSSHTFSFASYSDSKHENLHSLRVINEDRVLGGHGFGRHGHADFEIFSYIVSGALRHNDSLGHEEVLPRGSVQMTSAGSGVEHSEVNASADELCHFIQIWVTPNTRGLKPSYATRKFNDKDKTGRLRCIVSKNGEHGSVKIRQDFAAYACILHTGSSLTTTVQPGRELYIHLIQDIAGFDTEHNRTALTITDAAGKATTIAGGDGVTITHSKDAKGAAPQTFTLTGAGKDGAIAEFLLFDLAQESGKKKK